MDNTPREHPGIYAFITDGEGILSFQLDNHHLPMVCLGEDGALLPKLIDAAQLAATKTGKTVRLVHFTAPKELKVFAP